MHCFTSYRSQIKELISCSGYLLHILQKRSLEKIHIVLKNQHYTKFERSKLNGACVAPTSEVGGTCSYWAPWHVIPNPTANIPRLSFVQGFERSREEACLSLLLSLLYLKANPHLHGKKGKHYRNSP